jgi:dUTP pyrophosphatase
MTEYVVYTEKITSNFAILKIFINPEKPELVELYRTHIENHNNSMKNDPFPNSGFDIFIPEKVNFDCLFVSKLVNTEIKTEMLYCHSGDKVESSAYSVHPRSSISKTPLMLANHTGIVDQGYRGWLYGAFRCIFFPENYGSYVVEKHTRLLQICHPSLCPVFVEIVDSEDALSKTKRDTGGFGSTGILGSI